MNERDEYLETALRRVSRPIARAEFRERLRGQFLDVEGTDAAAAHAAPRRRSFPLIWPVLLAASVALIVFFVVSRDRELRWRVLDVAGTGVVKVDGVSVDVADRARLEDLIQTVQDLETTELTLRLILRDELVVELGPATHVGQMRFPVGGQYSMRVDVGSARLCTGPDFVGNALRVHGQNLTADCIGTVFAVDVEMKGSCLCCLEGIVDCDARDGRGKLPCAAGKMCFAPNDGTPPMWSAAKAMHTQPLNALSAWAAGHWRR